MKCEHRVRDLRDRVNDVNDNDVNRVNLDVNLDLNDVIEEKSASLFSRPEAIGRRNALLCRRGGTPTGAIMSNQSAPSCAICSVKCEVNG